MTFRCRGNSAEEVVSPGKMCGRVPHAQHPRAWPVRSRCRYPYRTMTVFHVERSAVNHAQRDERWIRTLCPALPPAVAALIPPLFVEAALSEEECR
jgi:hypothetical protein